MIELRSANRLHPAPPKSDISDLGHLRMSNSGRPELGWGGRVGAVLMRKIVAVAPPDRRSLCSGGRPSLSGEVSPALVSRPCSFPLTVVIFALAFLLPAFSWISGAVTIPWDAKSQFYPPVQFLATSIARGERPWWTPNVFAGWPLIADPQSLLFSPLHVLLA